MNINIFIFILGIAGICETGYMILSHMKSKPPVCPIEGCEKVLESRYNKTFGIHNDILGFLFYLFISAVSAFILFDLFPAEIGKWPETILWLSILFGSAFSLFLFFVQWKIVKAWCFWCLMSAFTIWLMLVSIIADFLFRS